MKEKSKSITCHKGFRPDFVAAVAKAIVTKLMIEEKYRDPKYSAKQLAKDLGLNQRYVSAIMKLRFQRNYAQLVGEMRVQEAMYMLQDEHFKDMKMEDIAINTGYSNRQNFYLTFCRIAQQTPLEYRLTHAALADLNDSEEETDEA